MERVDCLVVGAGVVGLAIARELAQEGLETLIVEEAETIGTGTSSRNSEVIHAGIYYPRMSLKHRLCIEGRQALYAYAERNDVTHARCGKLIVATSEAQNTVLAELATRARACGVHDVECLSASEAQRLEPELACTAALLSPSTGIIDSHGLMMTLLGDAQRHGAAIAFLTKVVACEPMADGIRVMTVDADGRQFDLQASIFINACGLQAPELASSIAGLEHRFIPSTRFAKGNYFSAGGRAQFMHLVYPVPQEGGLGVHLTLDLDGRMRFGPDVEWVESIDYGVDPKRADRFYEEIRKYWPKLPDGALQPAYSGIRPKLYAAGTAVTDFVIEGPQTHGIKGLVNLFGIESPGLTSSLAIAKYVAGLTGHR
ncbi:MAG: NAD(P)/FAD-dependent oxidoreductase [Phyllobacterium sp.]